ncbi:unnamed protein product [Eruca vesicaria subsp. sativa]|uniref:Thaumatin-like protein n=1 Tax=Eruca vesicaria subsp. sativa TaxID=29727 RepID=A0ABC8K8S5_ERUVS|nr:unnamed protein product [Eruca vesicaria subsp. sativa]
MADELLVIFLLVSYLFVSGVTSRNFTIENKCDYTVWPATFNSPGSINSLSTTGFTLRKGEARVINAPLSWTGRFWGRTFCSTNSTGSFSCATGDCGTGKVECSAASAGSSFPATLAEFSLDTIDYYDVSVVNGYNLPISIVPQEDKTCNSTGCVVDMNVTCPFELRVTASNTSLIACMNACQKLKLPEYCCTDDYASPDKCKPSLYSQNFKSVCPRAYSYVYDDTSSTFSCASNNYAITFCPSTILSTTNSSVADSPFPAQTKDGGLGPPTGSQPTNEATTEQKKKLSWKLKLIMGTLSLNPFDSNLMRIATPLFKRLFSYYRSFSSFSCDDHYYSGNNSEGTECKKK